MPKVPERYRYEPKNHHLSRSTGPPIENSGMTIDALSGVPPGALLSIQDFGERVNVPLPLRSLVPDLVTTFAATPIPSGAAASSPLVLIWTSEMVSSGSAAYPAHGLMAEVMSAPSISVEDDTMPEPWT